MIRQSTGKDRLIAVFAFDDRCVGVQWSQTTCTSRAPIDTRISKREIGRGRGGQVSNRDLWIQSLSLGCVRNANVWVEENDGGGSSG